MRLGSASGSRKTIRSRHVPPSTSARRQDGGAQRAAAALAAGEQAVDQQAEPLLELRARRGLGQLELLLQALERGARCAGGRPAAGEVVRAQAGRAEAVGDGGARELGEVAERGDAEALERLGQGGAAPRRPRSPRRACAAGRRAAGRGRRGPVASTTSARRGRAREAAARAAKRVGAGADARRAGRRRGGPRRRRRAGRRGRGAARGRRRRRGRGGRSRPPRRSPPARAAARRGRRRRRRGRAGRAAAPGSARAPPPAACPARTPNVSAAADASPTTGSRPGLGRQGERAGQLGVAAGGDRQREARELEADDHEHMFAHRASPNAASPGGRSPMTARRYRLFRYIVTASLLSYERTRYDEVPTHTHSTDRAARPSWR